MLDAFLEVLVEKEARHSAREEMADAFMALPKDELHKIASGSMKLADYDDHEWLSKFKGTPLYEPALQLEQQCLELDIQQQQQQQARQQETEQDQAVWNAKDGIRLKKRMLDLELLKMESSTEAGGNIASGQEAPAPDMQQQQAAAPQNPQGVAGAPMENVPKTASARMAKVAAELQAGQRGEIKGKNFAVHPKGDEPKYPIHDEPHARNALTRVRQFGTPAEKAQVFAAITKKYPALSTRSDVIPEKTQAKAEKKLGLPKGGESQEHTAPKQKLGEAILAMRMEKVALSSTALGALAGGGIGAATGLLSGGPDAQGQTHRLRNALALGAGGAGLGALGGASLSGVRKMEQTAGKGVAAQAGKAGKAAGKAERAAVKVEQTAAPAAAPAAADAVTHAERAVAAPAAAAAEAAPSVVAKARPGGPPVRANRPAVPEGHSTSQLQAVLGQAPPVTSDELALAKPFMPSGVAGVSRTQGMSAYAPGNTQMAMPAFVPPGMEVRASVHPHILAAMRMNKLAAMRSPEDFYSDQLHDALSSGLHPAHARELALQNIAADEADWARRAAEAKTQPFVHGAKGAAGGGLLGAGLGAALGLPIGGIMGRPGTGAAIGAGLGGLAGGVLGATRGPRSISTAEEAAALKPHLQGEALHHALLNHSMQVATGDEDLYAPEDRQKALAYMHHAAMGKQGSAIEVADAWGREMAQMEKDAIPFLGGLKGVANVFKTGLNKGVSSGAMKAGYSSTKPGALAGMKNVGHYATNWAAKNPTQAGAMLGAGVGAVGGAATAEKGHRLGGALKGGALGGAAGGAIGYAAPRISSSMGHGMSFGQAAQGAAKQGLSDVSAMGNRAMDAFKQSGAPLAAAASG